MIIIYCIEDINNNKYIGSTKQKLESRFSAHNKYQRSWAIACKYNNLLDIDISFFD